MDLELRERDYQILATLFLFRISSLRQISKLYFPSEDSARKQLLKLINRGFIVRTRLTEPKSSRWVYVYTLSRAGLYDARSWLEVEHKRVLPVLHYTVTPNQVQHELLMVDVFVKLVQEKCLTVEDLFLGNFVDSRLAPVLPSVFEKRQTLRPDARFEYQGTSIWIEIDRETERTVIIEEKIKSYQTYFSNNPGGNHMVLFLVDGKIKWDRIQDIRMLSGKYIGPHNSLGRVNWYTLTFADLDFVVTKLIHKEFFKSCVDELLRIGGKEATRQLNKLFDATYLKSVNAPACWMGFQDDKTGYMQVYIVDHIIGGQSGALQRLSYYKVQYAEYFNKNDGHKIKLIILYNSPREIEVVAQMYPWLIEKAIFVSVPELLSSESNLVLSREGILEKEG